MKWFSLTKLCKNFSPPQNLRNQQKIDAYNTRSNNANYFLFNMAIILILGNHVLLNLAVAPLCWIGIFVIIVLFYLQFLLYISNLLLQ